MSDGAGTQWDRLIRAKVASRYCNLTILQCYTPTNEAEED